MLFVMTASTISAAVFMLLRSVRNACCQCFIVTPDTRIVIQSILPVTIGFRARLLKRSMPACKKWQEIFRWPILISIRFFSR